MADIDKVIADLERKVLEFKVPFLTTEQHIRQECVRLVMSQPKTCSNPLRLVGDLADFIVGPILIDG